MGNNTIENKVVSENYLFATSKNHNVSIEIYESNIKPEQKEVFVKFLKSFVDMVNAMDESQLHAQFATRFAQLNDEFVKEVTQKEVTHN